MEYVFIVVFSFGFYWLVSHMTEKKRERLEGLENWTHDTYDHPFRSSLRLNFPTMTLVSEGEVMDDDLPVHRRTSHVRCTPAGIWEGRETDESLRAVIKELEAELAKPNAFLRSDTEQKLAEKRQELRQPKWEPLADELAAMIDTAHKRYIHQR